MDNDEASVGYEDPTPDYEVFERNQLALDRDAEDYRDKDAIAEMDDAVDAAYQEQHDAERDEPEDNEPRVYHNYRVETHDDGSATVSQETNDNGDTGYPGEYASWEDHWKSAEKAIKHVGKSRVGCAGCEVSVYIDGEKV